MFFSAMVRCSAPVPHVEPRRVPLVLRSAAREDKERLHRDLGMLMPDQEPFSLVRPQRWAYMRDLFDFPPLTSVK